MKEFRIIQISDNPNALQYKLEQHYGFWFIKWWNSPSFPPPHLFFTPGGAIRRAKEAYPDCVVYDHYSGNACAS